MRQNYATLDDIYFAEIFEAKDKTSGFSFIDLSVDSEIIVLP